MSYTNSPLVSYTKLSPNHSGQRTHSIDRITPHCVVGQCSVETLGNIFLPASRQASSNYGIGVDGRVGMYVEEKNRSYKFQSWVYDRELFVRAVSGSKITVSIYASGDITGNVDKKYLTLLTAAAEEPALIYTVVKGDTLWGIASKYLGSGTRYPEIVQLNGLKTSVIYSGQKLKIPQK